MRLHVKMEVYDSITSDEQVARTRKRFAESWKKMQDSGKVLTSGIFADLRGGYMVVDVDTAEELWALPMHGILDAIKMEVHPVMDADKFMTMFKDIGE